MWCARAERNVAKGCPELYAWCDADAAVKTEAHSASCSSLAAIYSPAGNGDDRQPGAPRPVRCRRRQRVFSASAASAADADRCVLGRAALLVFLRDLLQALHELSRLSLSPAAGRPVPTQLAVDHFRGKFFRRHRAGIHPERGFQAFYFGSSRSILAGQNLECQVQSFQRSHVI